MLLPPNKFFLLKKGYALLLLNHLVFGSGILCGLAEEDLLPLLVLDLDESLLLDLFLLAEIDGFLYLLSLLVPLVSHLVNFLLVFLLHHLLDAKLLHLLLDLDLILLLESQHLGCSLLGFLDLLPGTHLLLLEKGNAICEELGITLNTLQG